MVYSWLRNTYARNIYAYGVERFTARDGYKGIPVEYHEPVKQYVAETYTVYEISNALTLGFISQSEYNETMAYKNTI